MIVPEGIRLNWGCGPNPPAGWFNSDRVDGPGIDIVCDIRDGIPLSDRDCAYVVTHHALQMLAEFEVVPALAELHRVTAPGGWIRVSVPDLELAVAAYHLELAETRTYLSDLFPDDGDGAGALLNRYLTHYGQRSYWTCDFLFGALDDAGWLVPYPLPNRVGGLTVGETLSPFPAIVGLDTRPDESLILEAVRR